MVRHWPGVVAVLLFVSPAGRAADAAGEPNAAAAAQRYRQQFPVVRPLADGAVLCEAEEFQPHGDGPGWVAKDWGENYFCATFANAFLSRKAFLGAPETLEQPAVATVRVQVPADGKYLVLARYESVYRFETQFDVSIEQNGRRVFHRRYGARKNPKIWAFHQKIQTEVAWSWGAVENIVWEGHDAAADLKAGEATVTLTAQPQEGDAARRNVDCLLLTPHADDVALRIEKENYLPLDGLLTKAGDVHLRLSVPSDGSATTLQIPAGVEHSPYWVHLRTWKPKSLTAQAGQTTEWLEVGSLLDTLSDGQWHLTAATADSKSRKFTVEVGVQAGETIEPIARFDAAGPRLSLAYDANTRYTRRIRRTIDVLRDLVEFLEANPVHGKQPLRTIAYCLTIPDQPDDAEWTRLRNRFLELMPVTETELVQPASPVPKGYIDVRSMNDAQLEAHLKELTAKGLADRVACVSLGDEIGLPRPQGDIHVLFRAWLQSQSVPASEVVPAAGDDWSKIMFSPAAETQTQDPRLYFWSKRYEHAAGIELMKQRTDLIRRYLPHAGVGANFSPHHGHLYLGETHKWVTLFRRGGMTMPWSEDYIWQVPVGTQQMNFINLDLFRAGLKGRPDGKIHYYVMPHSPGITPEMWRRQFFGDLAHGMKVANLFEFRPVQLAYTENHVSGHENYLAVRRALYELGTFEDIIQDGQVERGNVALWFSETGDIWDDNSGPFAAGRRSLYIALLHQQLPLDFVTEDDALDGTLRHYRVLYITDRHVSRKATDAIVKWVQDGGRLFATAGAGMFDEYNEPNTAFQDLLGVRWAKISEPAEAVKYIKQDLPFAEPLKSVRWLGPNMADFSDPSRTVRRVELIPAFGTVAECTAGAGTNVVSEFEDGSAAVIEQKVGKGRVTACAILPGLSYFHSAIPRRPVDRGSRNDTMAHFLPTNFDWNAFELIGRPLADVPRPVACSARLVESRLIRSPHGVAIPLVNWSPEPVKQMEVRITAPLPGTQVNLASGRPVNAEKDGDATIFRFDLDVADVLVIRP
jgi:hypothetical protein